jgi:hypothetical protein
VARELGFTTSAANSIDGTSPADVVGEAAFVCAQIAIDLSRLSEDVIIWVTQEFRFRRPRLMSGRPARASCRRRRILMLLSWLAARPDA